MLQRRKTTAVSDCFAPALTINSRLELESHEIPITDNPNLTRSKAPIR
jgi:hypothetical protein